MALMKRFVIIIFAMLLPATASGFLFRGGGKRVWRRTGPFSFSIEACQ